MKVLPLDALGNKAELFGYYIGQFVAMVLPFLLFAIVAFSVYRILKKKKLKKF
ncbi:MULTISPECIES: hypothetical protein [unclassified Zunongwangia]|uniref:hypothetical protein n=1 Tax=unclassified Zunongwangia TaxID=2632541 RepID=UPI0022DDA166|nr:MULTISPECIES: hypothetical protein [unclassified Zunongwangia]WBL22245.1 hypothetical protein PBT89_16220 [Zunongwangia sp. HRR-M8]WBL25807.1 hypothetical protein PBT91_00595 [Zunongwangia sp. HGR-M22]